MSSLAEVLETYAPEISETDFAASLRSKFEQVTGTDDPGLTGSELAFLRDHGGDAARAAIDEWDPAGELVRRRELVADGVQHVLSRTLSAIETAGQTGRSRSQITRDLNGGKLYGLSVGRHWRIPRWQFSGGSPLPGLAQIVPSIPEHVHPGVIEGFMTTPQDELDGRTPIEHLLTGGRPATVADLVAGLARQ